MLATRAITNRFQDFQLLNLAPERGHPEHRGPFLLSQEGAAPGDARSRLCSFVLTRRGTWLHHFVLFSLTPEARARLVEFDSALDAVTFAGQLTGEPQVETIESITDWLNEEGLASALDRAAFEAERARLQARHSR